MNPPQTLRRGESPLASRKKLLVAESELNRAQLVEEWQMLTGDVHSLTKRAQTIGWLTSAAAALVAGVASFRHNQSSPATEKSSWLQTVLKGAGLVSTLWRTFRSPNRDQKDK